MQTARSHSPLQLSLPREGCWFSGSHHFKIFFFQNLFLESQVNNHLYYLHNVYLKVMCHTLWWVKGIKGTITYSQGKRDEQKGEREKPTFVEYIPCDWCQFTESSHKEGRCYYPAWRRYKKLSTIEHTISGPGPASRTRLAGQPGEGCFHVCGLRKRGLGIELFHHCPLWDFKQAIIVVFLSENRVTASPSSCSHEDQYKLKYTNF